MSFSNVYFYSLIVVTLILYGTNNKRENTSENYSIVVTLILYGTNNENLSKPVTHSIVVTLILYGVNNI